MTENSVESRTFWLKYTGPSVDDHSMDAYELGQAIISLSTLIEEVGQRIIGEAGHINLRVRGDFQAGSFLIDFDLLQTAKEASAAAIPLLSSPGISAIANVFQIIGINGHQGLLWLINKLKGRIYDESEVTVTGPLGVKLSDTETNTGDHRNRTVEIETTDGKVQTIKMVWDLYNNANARKAAAGLVKPLKEPGIEAIEIGDDAEHIDSGISISKEEAENFNPIGHSSEREFTHEEVLTVISPSFERMKWYVSVQGERVYVEIEDTRHWEMVDQRKLSFKKNDQMRVLMKTKVYTQDNRLKHDRTVLQVLDYMPADEQADLFDDTESPSSE